MRFIARQPIFDTHKNVFGHELLFREGLENLARIDDYDRAGRMTLDNSVIWGLDQLCNDRMAFVNCTRGMLIGGLVELLPPARTVVEVLENIRADAEVVEACRCLREKGYVIALDDVTSIEEVSPYLGVAELVKVDLRLTTPQRQAELARWLPANGIEPLAEKVETHHEFRNAATMGYRYFQGFYFQKPEIMRTRDIPAMQANYFRLLNALHESNLDFAFVEEIIRTEPSLCFRLLRYLNSPLFTFDFDITSVRYALALLGEKEIRKWLLVSLTSALGEQKSPELVVWALVRARFCELSAEASNGKLEGSFLLGLLSAFPALLEMPLKAILERLPIATNLKAALLGKPGLHRDLLQLMKAYEAGHWSLCSELANKTGSSEESLTAHYIEAVHWANQVTCQLATAAPPVNGENLEPLVTG